MNEMMRTTIEEVREMVDANTIIGEPIISGEITLIPVSKISIGFGTGGSELPSKHTQAGKAQPFGGGGGAGIKIEPVAFLSVHAGAVKLLPMAVIPADTALDRLVEMLPDLIDRVSQYIEKRKEEKQAKDELG